MDYQKWIEYGKTIASEYGDGEAKQVAVTRQSLDATIETISRLEKELRERREELAREARRAAFLQAAETCEKLKEDELPGGCPWYETAFILATRLRALANAAQTEPAGES